MKELGGLSFSLEEVGLNEPVRSAVPVAALGGPEIEHYHQAIAVVVADTFEQARAAAQLVRVDYVRADGAFDLSTQLGAAKPQKITGGPGESAVGDFAGAFSSAPVQLDATYTTPDEAHAMMEPHASTAVWDGDKLTLWTSNQMIAWNKADIAKTLGMPKESVRLISPFIGGGFGASCFRGPTLCSRRSGPARPVAR